MPIRSGHPDLQGLGLADWSAELCPYCFHFLIAACPENRALRVHIGSYFCWFAACSRALTGLCRKQRIMSIMGLPPVDRQIKSKFAARLGLRASLPIDAEAVANADRFRNEAGLNKLATDWPAARLVENLEQPAGRGSGQEVQRIARLQSAGSGKLLQSLGQGHCRPYLT